VDDPEVWRWVWLVAALGFGLGEMASAGTFFLGPFAIGAVGAAIVSFIGAPIALGWIVFIGLSAVSFAALRPVARRLELTTRTPLGVGATRLVGEQGVMLAPVPEGPDEVGLVRLGREEWRAQSLDGSPIAQGTPVTVLEVRGTRVVVFPTGLPIPSTPPERPLS
jgi:membrane protein implicated in regulation of membrane protease activity